MFHGFLWLTCALCDFLLFPFGFRFMCFPRALWFPVPYSWFQVSFQVSRGCLLPAVSLRCYVLPDGFVPCGFVCSPMALLSPACDAPFLTLIHTIVFWVFGQLRSGLVLLVFDSLVLVSGQPSFQLAF